MHGLRGTVPYDLSVPRDEREPALGIHRGKGQPDMWRERPR